MTIDLDTIRHDVIERIEAKANIIRILREHAAELHNNQTLSNPGRRPFAYDIAALGTMTGLLFKTMQDDIMLDVNQLAALTARDVIAPYAKQSGDEPVVFITGNSMMPPHREITECNLIWEADSTGNFEGLLWSVFIEELERKLEENMVYLTSPDDDNCLYAVDLNRFKPRNEWDMETWQEEQPNREFSLSDEWAPRNTADGICISCSNPEDLCVGEDHGFDPERK